MSREVKFRKAKVRVPLRDYSGKTVWHSVTQREGQQLTYNAYRRSLPFAHRKPGRRLGGAYMDDFVQQRQAVNLCDSCCLGKYSHWWERYNYRPDFSPFGRKRGECDGCDASFVMLTPFYPEEVFFQSLINPSKRRN